MKEFLRKNFALLLAFALPMVLIAVVALSAYLPSLFLSTKYNFIYTSCSNGTAYSYYGCNEYLQKLYVVENNKLVKRDTGSTEDTDKDGVLDKDEKYDDRIFLHDTESNESREITLAEAQALTLNNLITSPDGVTVGSAYDRRSGGDFFPFGGGSSTYNYYLTKGDSRKKINLVNSSDRYYYRENFQFLGWVLPGRN